MNEHTHYQAPQTIAPLGLIFAGIGALLMGIGLSAIYSYATVYIPFIYINLLLTMLFGGTIGLGIALALRLGHFQHSVLSYTIVGLSALFAYWMHWVWWFSALAFQAGAEDFSMLTMLFPPVLIEVIGAANEVGTWGIRSSDAVSGLALSMIWLIEAILFFGSALVGSIVLIGSGTYCTQCKKWCVDMTPVRLQADPTGELILKINGEQDWSVLMRPAPSDEAAVWHEMTIHHCEKCAQTHTLTIKNVTLSHDKKGNEERKDEIVVDRVIISPHDVQTLLNA